MDFKSILIRMVKELKPNADYLFEASWEVCNKVGGIYTVVKSKAYLMKEYYRNYFSMSLTILLDNIIFYITK